MFNYEVLYQNEYGVWTELEDFTRPIIIKRTLDETHDEGQIFLSCSEIDKPFKPFTKFIINISEKNDDDEVINTETIYMVSTADKMEQKTFDEEPFLYNHDIRLAEATKELERYTVDNLSFTNYWAKAFQTSTTSFNIKSEEYGDVWYNNNYPIISTAGNQEWWVNAFTNPNSNDAGRYLQAPFTSVKPKIEDTFIYKTISQNSGISQYNISANLPTTIVRNSQIVIPYCSFNQIGESELYNQVQSFFWRDMVFTQFNKYISSIRLLSPLGNIINVNQGQTIQLSEEGIYKLQYVIRTDVRLKYQEWGRVFDHITRGPEYTQWYLGNETIIECEILSLTVLGGDIQKLSIYDILNKICQITPTRFNETDQQKFFISNESKIKYGGIEAPELIITGKNLWEALLQVGGILNAIPYLKITDRYNWNVIDFMPLSSEERVADTVEEEYCDTQASYLSDSYTASYDIYAENMINPLSTNEGQINEQGWYVAKTLRSEEVEISETSMDIETVYPIYRVNKLRYVDYSTNPITDADITAYLEEYALYNTEKSNQVGIGKDIHMYFTQGKRNIYGLQYKVSKNQFEDAKNKISIKKIIASVIGGDPENINLFNAKFIVEYVPYLNARIRYFKPNAPKLNIDTSMFQNQSSNVIDTVALGRKMVANLGRTSNLGYVDSIKVYHLNEIPIRGQRSTDGYFVSDVIVEYDQNHLLASISYTKDYQKISDYININNLQRYFEVSEKQSLDRYVNTHMFYVFGDPIAEIHKEYSLNGASGYPTPNYIASLLYDHGYNRKINASLLKSFAFEYNLTQDLTYQSDKAYYKKTGDRYDYLVSGVDYEIGEEIPQPNTEIYDTTLEKVAQLYLNSNAISSGNQISIITDFQDNYGAGYQALAYMDGQTQAKMNKSVPYANQYGEVKQMEIQNLTDSNIVYGSGSQTLENNMNLLANALPATTALDDNNKPTGADYFVIADSYQNNNMPTFSNMGSKQTILLNKDSREIIHINQQHHFLKNKDSIIIGNAMTEKCRYIQQTDFKSRLVFLKDTIDDYEFKIKETDIIPVQAVGTDERLTRSTILVDLCDEINATNILHILSAEGRDGKQINTRYSSATITGVSVNQTTWESQVQYSGFYTFTYNGTNWLLAEQVVNLADYGISITGTATNNDTITVIYNTSVFIQPLAQYNGSISGLTQDAKAWAIVTENNDLIIGQNINLYEDDLGNDNQANAINLSVTSKY